MRNREKPNVVIRGGCPDGFWALANCERAAQLGLCSVVTRTDNRIVTTDGKNATVTRPTNQAGGA